MSGRAKNLEPQTKGSGIILKQLIYLLDFLDSLDSIRWDFWTLWTFWTRLTPLALSISWMVALLAGRLAVLSGMMLAEWMAV